MNREQLIQLVTRIMSGEGTEEEQDALLDQLVQNVPDPEVSDLIFHPETHPNNPSGRELTAEEVVDIAISYKPIRL